MKVKISLNLGMSTVIQDHCFCLTERIQRWCSLLNIWPQTYLIPYKCVSKASSVFSQIILQVDDKFDFKDKTIPLKLKHKTWHHKTPKRDHRQNILWYKSYQRFLRSVFQGNRKKMGPNQTYKPLHSKGSHKQNEKTTYRMGENICKQYDQ